MPPKIQHRDVAGFLSRIRDFFLGRTHNTALRFADTLSPRTQPAPEIPRGPSQGLSANYYYMRDPRGQMKPLVDLLQKQKSEPDAKAKAEAAKDVKPDAKEKPEAAKDAKPDAQEKAKAAKDEKSDTDQEDPEAANDKAKKLPTPGKIHSWEGPY
ncbi:hypothetical protein KR032_007505 [Drosophila birchii]|nr:hypothetical protein KR032_007505 [Drosophila birchii]